MNARPTALLAAAALAGLAAAAARAQSDNFDDNTTGPQWSLVLDSASELSLNETNGRVEAVTAITAGTSSTTDALYLSNGVSGFTMSTASDFTLTIDYTLGPATQVAVTPGLAMVFGVGVDPDGFDSAAIGIGYTPLGVQLVGAYRIDDSETLVPLLSEPSTGTFTIAYQAGTGDLTLGTDNKSFTLPSGTVLGSDKWNASELLVSFGFRGNGYNLTAGGTYFDNFTAVPEPATAVLLLGAVVSAATPRRRGH